MKPKPWKRDTGSRRDSTVASGRGNTLQIFRFAAPVLIVLGTSMAFLPILQNGFVGWDDEGNLLRNPHYRGLNWEHLRWMFGTFYYTNYRPITWITYGFDYLLWGVEPFGYHLTSLLFHVVNAVLFYFLAFRLLLLVWPDNSPRSQIGSRVAAAFSALFFAIHPLRVESVAWVSARNDVVAGLFLLLTVICYLRAADINAESRHRLWLGASIALYALSLLSKGMGIGLPIVFLALDVYPLRRMGIVPRDLLGQKGRKVWLEKLPFFALALGAGVLALIGKQQGGLVAPLERYGLVERVMQSMYGLGFYVRKTIVPVGLSPLYELPRTFNPWDWPFILSGVTVLALTIGLVIARRHWPAGLTNWICYGAMLAPFLGIVQFGPQMVADRYSYHSCLGWAILLGGAILYSSRFRSGNRPSAAVITLVVGLGVISLFGLGRLTWKQARVWGDTESLWKHAVAISPQSSIAHYNYGNALERRGEIDEAIKHYHEAIRTTPAYIRAHNNLGIALERRGDLEGAVEHYRQALRLDPTLAEAHYNLGSVLARRGELDQAILHFRETVRWQPQFAEAHESLGRALALQGKQAEAIEHMERAVEILRLRSRE